MIKFTTETAYFLVQSILNPLLWNIIARSEYRTQWMSKLFGNNYRACYFLALCIFSAGIWRDYLFKLALESQVYDQTLIKHPLAEYIPSVGLLLIALGNIFVLSSMYALGITGTYLGDYFGILMKSRVTAFPFNVMANPMYNGSTMIFLGTALWYQKLSGVYLSIIIYILYKIALSFEEPFTAMIYSKVKQSSGKSSPGGTRSSPRFKRKNVK